MRFAGEKQEEKGRRIRLCNRENSPEKRKNEICGGKARREREENQAGQWRKSPGEEKI